MPESHDIKSITCTVCGLSFKEWQLFAKHRDLHEEPEIFEKVHPPAVPH